MLKNKIFLFVGVLLFLAGCSTRGVTYYGGSGGYTPPSGANTKYNAATMRPYQVRGITYYPTVVSVGDHFSGRASWYGPDFHGKSTSNGEVYDMNAMTAAHKTLPMNTIVKVTSLANGRSVIVRINDRGPFVDNRIIDLSKEAASTLNMIGTGTALVTLDVLGFGQIGSQSIPTTEQLKQGPSEEIVTAFAIQIGSFVNINGARITQQKYNGIDGYKTIIKDIDDGRILYHKVWITGFKSEAEARDYQANGRFAHSFIVKE